MTECPKCGRENGWAYSEGYLCERCKKNGRHTIYLVCSILAILGIFIGAFFGIICFDYEKQKCSYLKSTESNYDFDHKIEIDADYNQHCYFINNHPLALIRNIFIGALFGITIPIFIGLFWSFRYI